MCTDDAIPSTKDSFQHHLALENLVTASRSALDNEDTLSKHACEFCGATGHRTIECNQAPPGFIHPKKGKGGGKSGGKAQPGGKGGKKGKTGKGKKGKGPWR